MSTNGKKRPLPPGWRWARLGDPEVCTINPRRPPGFRRAPEESTTAIPMSAVDDERGTISAPEVRPFQEVTKGYTYFEEGDVLFAKITPCMENGKSAIARGLIDRVGFGSTEFHVLRPGPLVSAEWLYFFVRQPSFRAVAARYFTGSVGQQRVPEEFLDRSVIPLPPLAEQRRIAARLSEQMAQVERMRQAAEAQVEAARALPAAFLRRVFDSEEARRWPRRRLGDIAFVSGGIQKSPNRTPNVFHRPYLTVRNVNRGWLDLSDVERFEITPDELERCRLEVGDILVVEGNGSLNQIGRNAIFRGEIEDCIHQNHVIRVRVNRMEAEPEFISRFLNSDLGQVQMVEKARTTTGLNTLSVSKVEQLEVPTPPLDEQQRTTAQLSKQLTDAERLLHSAQAQLEAINTLPGALLEEVFGGFEPLPSGRGP